MTKKKKMLHFKQKVTAKNELAILLGGGDLKMSFR